MFNWEHKLNNAYPPTQFYSITINILGKKSDQDKLATIL